MSSTAEYDLIQAQIMQRKAELASTGLPEDMRKLREQIGPYPAWVQNFGWPMHPLVSGIDTTADHNTTRFTFNAVKYEITFERGYPSYPSTSRLLTEITGKLLVKADGILVLDSRFYGESDEYGDTYRYHDSDTYKKGPWVQDLLRFKKESNQLIEAARAQSELATKQNPAVLQAMREKFNIPTVVPSQEILTNKVSWSPPPNASHIIGAVAAIIVSANQNIAAFLGAFFVNAIIAWWLPVLIASWGRKKASPQLYNWRLFCTVMVGSLIILGAHFTN